MLQEQHHVTHNIARVSRGNTRRRELECDQVLRMVCRARGVRAQRVIESPRGSDNIIMTRHLTMYLLHVVCSRTLTDIGGHFMRDRTSVGHACARVEDARDDQGFDDYVAALEERVETLLGHGGCND